MPQDRPAGRFAYLVAYRPEEAEIAALELLRMTGARLEGRLAWSCVACDISVAAYTRLVLEVLAQAESFERLLEQTAALGLAAQGFAVDVERVPPRPRIVSQEAARRLADLIEGRPNLSHPRVRFLLVAQEGRYLFGRVISLARRDWHDAGERPVNFSNSLTPRLSRAVVNLVAAPGDTLLDPCCGSGTVLIEAEWLGVRARGWDLAQSHVEMTLRNLAHFGCRTPVAQGDARELTAEADAAVLDLPYGHTSRADDELYLGIVSRVARCVRRLAVLTGADKAYLWRQLELQVLALARVPETNLVRHVYVLRGRRA